MTVKESGRSRPAASTLARILSPLLAWLAFVAYLAFFSRSPFLLRWLDGSFALFVALVLCNLLRRSTLGEPADDGPPEQAPPGGGGDGKPGTSRSGAVSHETPSNSSGKRE